MNKLLIVLLILLFFLFDSCEELPLADSSRPVPLELNGRVFSWAYSYISNSSDLHPENTGDVYHIVYGFEDEVYLYKNFEKISNCKIEGSLEYHNLLLNDIEIRIDYSDEYLSVYGYPYLTGRNIFFEADKNTWKPDFSYINQFEGEFIGHWYQYYYNEILGFPIVYRTFMVKNVSNDWTPFIEFLNPSEKQLFFPNKISSGNYHFSTDTITKHIYNYDHVYTSYYNNHFYAYRILIP